MNAAMIRRAAARPNHNSPQSNYLSLRFVLAISSKYSTVFASDCQRAESKLQIRRAGQIRYISAPVP
jgi:hypothetical protein